LCRQHKREIYIWLTRYQLACCIRTGFGSINYRDILQYIALGDKRLSQELNDDDDEDDVDKGVWGASPIVDIQLSTSDLEEVSSHEEPHI
jgi:hypothetical protein